MKRDNQWLKKRLLGLWQKHFSDKEIKNNLFVRFGRPAKRQLGRITSGASVLRRQNKFGRRKINPNTYIIINGLFKNRDIPQFVVDATLAHELCHYFHGFCSPYPKFQKYPHKGGVIKKEMEKRGLKNVLFLEKKWLKLNWEDYVKMHLLSNR